MKRIKNKEFMLTIQNLLCAEEHAVDMLLTAKEKEYKTIKNILDVIKLERNLLLNFPEEKDRNKWCLIKHLLLANYHSLEMINNGGKDINESIINFYIKRIVTNKFVQSFFVFSTLNNFVTNINQYK